MSPVGVFHEGCSSSITIGLSNDGQLGVQLGMCHALVPRGGPICGENELVLSCATGRLS